MPPTPSTPRRRTAFHVVEDLFQQYFVHISLILLAVNLCGALFIIERVPYTEIDWETYMTQVSLVIKQHQFNYEKIDGPTGPLVYPAAHVYIYSAFYYLTSSGTNIRLAQYTFAILHTTSLALLLHLYRISRSFPLTLTPLLFLSRRALSLFVLRLFNDAVQTIPIYLFLLLAARNRWRASCLLFSFSVAIKMNALLYAPGLAVLLLQAEGPRRALQLALTVCLPLQILLSTPFLLVSPRAYASRAFELTRKFLYKWSVNGAFLPEDMFTSRTLAAILLLAHVITLFIFAQTKWTLRGKGLNVLFFTRTAWRSQFSRKLSSSHILRVLLTANFVGVAFARTLHYQFYLWYVHSLPLLVARTKLPVGFKIATIMAVEVVFNIYPPRALPALALTVAHVVVLTGLFGENRVTDRELYEERRDDQVRVKST